MEVLRNLAATWRSHKSDLAHGQSGDRRCTDGSIVDRHGGSVFGFFLAFWFYGMKDEWRRSISVATSTENFNRIIHLCTFIQFFIWQIVVNDIYFVGYILDPRKILQQVSHISLIK